MEKRKVVLILDLETDKKDALHGDDLAMALEIAIGKVGKVEDLTVFEQLENESLSDLLHIASKETADDVVKSKDFNINQLDKTTLEFAIKIAWQSEFMCKKTKEGRTLAHAYSNVQKTLTHYLQKISELQEK
jgi:hypothetical protein